MTVNRAGPAASLIASVIAVTHDTQTQARPKASAIRMKP